MLAINAMLQSSCEMQGLAFLQPSTPLFGRQSSIYATAILILVLSMPTEKGTMVSRMGRNKLRPTTEPATAVEMVVSEGLISVPLSLLDISHMHSVLFCYNAGVNQQPHMLPAHQPNYCTPPSTASSCILPSKNNVHWPLNSTAGYMTTRKNLGPRYP